MKTMFRNMFGLISVTTLLVLILIFLGWSHVPDIISKNLSKKLKTSVEIGDIDILLSRVSIDKFEIGNPQGYVLPKAFSCEKTVISAPLTRYYSHAVEIDSLDMQDVYVGLEFSSPFSSDGNWTTLVKNLKNSLDLDMPSDPKDKRSVLIKELSLSNVQIDLIYKSEDNKLRHLPLITKIKLHNISSEGGAPIGQITNIILAQVLKEVLIEQNLKGLLDHSIESYLDVLSPVGGTIKNLLSPLLPN